MSGLTCHKVCMKTVTFSEIVQVVEYVPDEGDDDAQPQDEREQTLARKPGRPRKLAEAFSPLEEKEKRML